MAHWPTEVGWYRAGRVAGLVGHNSVAAATATAKLPTITAAIYGEERRTEEDLETRTSEELRFGAIFWCAQPQRERKRERERAGGGGKERLLRVGTSRRDATIYEGRRSGQRNTTKDTKVSSYTRYWPAASTARGEAQHSMTTKTCVFVRRMTDWPRARAAREMQREKVAEVAANDRVGRLLPLLSAAATATTIAETTRTARTTAATITTTLTATPATATKTLTTTGSAGQQQ